MVFKNFAQMDDRKRGGTDDLATLSELNEEIILHELRARYSQDVIYVRIFPRECSCSI